MKVERQRQEADWAEANIVPWLDQAFETLCVGTAPKSDDYPPWLVEGGYMSKLIGHWRTDPTVPGP
jgi:hypothetical protein